MKNNLFSYATSELSQDAFICYLFSFAFPEYENNDTALATCAKELLGQMLKTDNYNGLKVTDIKRQYKRIDILVIVNNNTYIIIEDKTFTGQKKDQLKRYKKALKDEGINEENIHCVFFKIVEQAFPEANVVNITRKDLLRLFNKYKSKNQIYNDYKYYLEHIEKDVASFEHLPIGDWRKLTSHAYRGFFTHLVNKKIIDTSKEYGWNYVNNPAGGFWGLWWYYFSRDELNRIGLTKEYVDNLYLQIEDNRIAVKLSAEKSEDKNLTTDMRWKLYSFFSKTVEGFQKQTYRKGKFMTVGSINYDMSNYREKIEIMENAFDILKLTSL